MSITHPTSYMSTIPRKGAEMSASEWATSDVIERVERNGSETTVN